MASNVNEIIRPTGHRLANQYKAVDRKVLAGDQYPCTLPSTPSPTHDLVYYQNVLGNQHNFSERTNCDIFHVNIDGSSWLRCNLQDKELRDYMDASTGDNVVNATRVIFLTSQRFHETTFASQVSLSHAIAYDLLQAFEISPHFVPYLLSEPDYAAPSISHIYDDNGQLCQQEFICQHPRWDIHTKMQPCSVYMNHQSQTAVTTYIVVSGQEDTCIGISKSRLQDAFRRRRPGQATQEKATDPFLLHNIIAQESFLQSKPVITKLRFRLYDQLDKVDAYGKGEEIVDRAALKALTNELHLISQDADSLVAGAEMGTMITERMYEAHRTLKTSVEVPLQRHFCQVEDSLGHLVHSLQARRRWILSYKSRKDIAMNLVFNLVTQQDSETNMAIARDTKNDSAAMKTIAALTMIFLPATAVSSFFGMAFFNGQGGVLTVTGDWWLFLAATLPITVILFMLWASWDGIFRAVASIGQSSTNALEAFKLESRNLETKGKVPRRQSLLRLLSGSSTQSTPEKDSSNQV